MSVNPKYLIYHDLIGLSAKARLKSNSSRKNFFDIGVTIDDTQNMLITEKDGITKQFIKKNYVFRFKLPNEDALEVNGEKIVGRPENRLRNLKKKRRLK